MTLVPDMYPLRRLTCRAFGLEIDAGVEVAGLPATTGTSTGRRLTLDCRPAAELDADWPSQSAVRLSEERSPGGELERAIDMHAGVGYRLFANRFGLARISLDGATVACAPADGAEPWDWQRFLVGRVLPWAAVLRGLEVLHAAAVAFDGRAVAFAGPSGSGKTSLALQFVAGGADFISDDVLAIERWTGDVRAHPGACTASARPGAVPDACPGGLWTVLGEHGKTHLALERVDKPLPVRAICFLEQGAGPPVEVVSSPDPRLLLASTFVLGVTTPERLANQLDICAAIARDVTLLRVRVSSGTGFGGLADEVRRSLWSSGIGT